MNYGYIRVSTKDQTTARQDLLMEQLGVDDVFVDIASGKNQNRPELKKLMRAVQAGDCIVVESISRFARNTKDLLDLVDQLMEKDVGFVSKKETIDTTTPAGRFVLTVFGALSELERGYLLDRQREGIAIKKAAGGYSGANHVGKPRKKVDAELFEYLYHEYKAGKIGSKDCANRLGYSKNVFFRRIKERDIAGEGYNPNNMNIL